MAWDKQFWYTQWPRVGLIVAIYSLLFLFFNSKYPIGALGWWIWLSVPLYMFHQYEEYVLPGGFQQEINRILSRSQNAEEKITSKDTFYINILYIWVAGPVLIILGTISITFTLIWISLFAVNGVVHIIGSLKMHKYNPGLLFSLIFNLPLGMYSLIQIWQNGLATIVEYCVGIVIGVILHAFLFVFLILKARTRRN